MDIDEFINSTLYKEFYQINKKYFDDIFSHIEKCDEFFSLESRTVRYETIEKKMRNNKHRIDLRIKKTENGIKVPFEFDDLFSLIKPHIPKSISSIKLPISKIDIKDLSDFKKLDTLITDDHLYFDDLKNIERYTNIKTIYASFSHSYYLPGDDIAYTDDLLLYKDIKVIDNSYKSYGGNSLVIKPSTKNIKEIKDSIKKFNLEKLSRIYIRRSDNVNISVLFEKNKTVLVIICKDYDYIYKYYNMLKEFNINVDEILISAKYLDKNNCERNINYSEIDFDKLDKFSEKVKLSVTYNCNYYYKRESYEEYRTLVEAIKYYKNLINTYPLSPLEKLTFAYDIMKSFLYNEGKKIEDSREAHRVIVTGNIVCAGYVDLLNEILYELDENIESSEIHIQCHEKGKKMIGSNHVRNIVRINDDKYNVHGFYLLDVTWDSFNPYYYDVFVGYDALSLYKHFLVPLTRYDDVFEDEELMYIFDGKLDHLNNGHITDEVIDDCIFDLENNGYYLSVLYDEFKDTFCIENEVEALKEIKSRRISLDEFLTLIRNVRVCEGYSGKVLEEEIDGLERMNAKFFNEKATQRVKKLK